MGTYMELNLWYICKHASGTALLAEPLVHIPLHISGYTFSLSSLLESTVRQLFFHANGIFVKLSNIPFTNFYKLFVNNFLV